MSQKIEVQLTSVNGLGNSYDLLFIDGVAHIDVGAFWKDQVDLRTDMFTPPDFNMAMLVGQGQPVREMRLCSVEALSQAIGGLKNAVMWNNYITYERHARLQSFCEVLNSVEATGWSATLYLDDMSSGHWEDL